jgi:hypothetical protein
MLAPDMFGDVKEPGEWEFRKPLPAASMFTQHKIYMLCEGMVFGLHAT